MPTEYNAILAERERCAKIAEEFDDILTCDNGCGPSIAQKIRQGEPDAD